MGKRKAPDDSNDADGIAPVSMTTPNTSTTIGAEVGSSSQASSHTNEAETTPTSTTEVSASKKKYGKVRSGVWLEMTRVSDTQAQCHHCKGLYAADNDVHGTSGLRKHLNRCAKNPNKKVEKGILCKDFFSFLVADLWKCCF
ncbi:uncharacterized protein LOC113303563 isoform X2 [Papaver somniferum]|uniref:uncharacterized protein LOC113303563 isoform X2 n=1 Tax=Papaver somniferum TaxID=3469 RepID=UPI000E703144|nr:uncharacterized protein LOC113303563 isoform X2 [Papaver somniferum]XP_026408389.1 uncharacterized protein LOC113303563 isoform X2 [Papaver somniferum]XP_026408390.1 uncharacterized protein LOC113303563 isoform X2 [Papaver somniferum]